MTVMAAPLGRTRGAFVLDSFRKLRRQEARRDAHRDCTDTMVGPYRPSAGLEPLEYSTMTCEQTKLGVACVQKSQP